MKIINARPPNFEAIAARFPRAYNKGVIFAYHGAIYAPFSVEVPPSLIAHESVHLERQGHTKQGAQDWWEKYLNDIDFMYYEELLAHRAEYQWTIQWTTSPKVKEKTLKLIAQKLAAPLYGFPITREDAAKDILGHKRLINGEMKRIDE